MILLWKHAQKAWRLLKMENVYQIVFNFGSHNWGQITVIYGDLISEDDRRYARIRLPNLRFRYTHVLSRMIFVTASLLEPFLIWIRFISEIQSSQNRPFRIWAKKNPVENGRTSVNPWLVTHIMSFKLSWCSVGDRCISPVQIFQF